MRLKFFISAEEEAKRIVGLFQTDDPLGVTGRAAQCGFPVALAVKINQERRADWSAQLDRLFLDTYRHNQVQLNQALEFFQNYWAENEARFFPVLDKVFGHPMPPYYVLLTHFIAGTSDWYGTDICVNAYGPKLKNKNIHVYGLLYEVILSQIFRQVRQKVSSERLGDWAVWEIAEIGAFTVLHQAFDLFDAFEKTYYEAVDQKLPAAQRQYRSAQNLDAFLEYLIADKIKGHKLK